MTQVRGRDARGGGASSCDAVAESVPGYLDHGTRAPYLRNRAGDANAGGADAFFDEKEMDIDQGMWDASSSR